MDVVYSPSAGIDHYQRKSLVISGYSNAKRVTFYCRIIAQSSAQTRKSG